MSKSEQNQPHLSISAPSFIVASILFDTTSCFSYSTVWITDMLHPSETPALHSSVLDFNVFNHRLCSPCLLSVVVLCLDALGSISHSQANVNGSYFVLYLFYILKGWDRWVQVSELLWRGTSGTLINHLLRHQTVLPDDLRITNLGCRLLYGALKV